MILNLFTYLIQKYLLILLKFLINKKKLIKNHTSNYQL